LFNIADFNYALPLSPTIFHSGPTFQLHDETWRFLYWYAPLQLPIILSQLSNFMIRIITDIICA